MNRKFTKADWRMFVSAQKEAVKSGLWARVAVRFTMGNWDGMRHVLVVPATSVKFLGEPGMSACEVLYAEWLPKSEATKGRVDIPK